MNSFSSSPLSLSELWESSQKLPKAELHAHLNGSITTSTLEHILQEEREHSPINPDIAALEKWVCILKKAEKDLSVHGVHSLLHRQALSFDIVFDLFALFHRLLSSPKRLRLATKHVVQEFRAEGVRYLELRSTPKENLAQRISKPLYIDSILAGIQDAQGSFSCNAYFCPFS